MRNKIYLRITVYEREKGVSGKKGILYNTLNRIEES